MRKYRKPYRIKMKKPISQNRFFRLGVISFVFVVLGCYLLFFSKLFQVKEIIIAGEEKVSKEELKLFIEEKLEAEILFFETKGIFAINLKEIRSAILNKFPKIAAVEIHRGIPDALNVVVIERIGIAKWCKEETCFLLDKEGVIFEEIDLETEIIKITDGQELALALGEKVIEKKLLSQIMEIERKLKEDLKIQLQEVLLVSSERINIKTSEGWKIYLNPQQDIEWQLTKLNAVLEEELSPERRRELEYIELRFGNFAPYK